MTNSPVVVLARCLLAAIFLVSGTNKILGFAAVSGMMAKTGFPLPDLFLAGAIGLDLLGGVLLIIGWQARPAALALALYTLVLAVMFHPFWSMPDAQVMNQLNHFLKNVAIAGGLLLVTAWPKTSDDLDPDQRT